MPRLRWIYCISAVFVLSACGGGTPSAEDIQITFTYPQANTVVYAEALAIQGTMTGADSHTMLVELLAGTGQPIAQAQITTQETWQVEIPHAYDGAPADFTIRAITISEDTVTEHISQNIIIADHRYRPDGIIGTIIFPTDDDPVGGTEIPVEGTASGIPNNTFTLIIIGADGAIITESTVLLNNPYLIDEVQWETTLLTEGYNGPATLQLIIGGLDNTMILDEVELFIGDAAG